MTKSTICLNMIVKDESHIIEETLNSVYKYIDYWVICDTGSTDNTKEIIIDFFQKHQIPGDLIEEPWHNHFGKNRTIALQACKNKADYAWVIDADDVVCGNLIIPKQLKKDAYLLNYGDENCEMQFDRAQLFKLSSDWFYVCALHEYADTKKKNYTQGKITGNYHIQSRRLGSRSKDPNKYLNDAILLENALKEEPQHEARYKFYIAQSYYDHGQMTENTEFYEKAIEWYKMRIEVGDFFEEVFYSKYQIANCLKKLNYDWEEVESAYMEAWRHSPERVEPLYELALHYRLAGDYRRGYKFAQIGSTIDFPDDLGLFLEKSLYEWGMLDELAVCASHIGKEKESEKIYEKLLKMENIPQREKNRFANGLEFLKNKGKITPKDKSKPNLVFFVGYASFASEEMYGSELALVFLAKHLAKNYNIFVVGFAQNNTKQEHIQFVRPRQFHEFYKNNEIEILIISRYIHYFIEFPIVAKRTYLWCHDMIYQNSWECKALPQGGKFLIANVLDKISGIVALTTWHKNFLKDYYDLPDQILKIIPNALNSEFFKSSKEIKKQEGRFIYTSNPAQCLREVVKILAILRRSYPHVELHVFRDENAFDYDDGEKLLEEIRASDFMFYGGKKTQAELAEEFLKSDFWLYPLHTHETYCMSALEAQCAGCYCVATDSTGLKDTVADRGVLVSDKDFITPLRYALDNPLEKSLMQAKCKEWAEKQTWEKRAEEWKTLFSEI